MWFLPEKNDTKNNDRKGTDDDDDGGFHPVKTEDQTADQEVSNIVAWALEDVKVTRDDASFEAIELVSSEDNGTCETSDEKHHGDVVTIIEVDAAGNEMTAQEEAEATDETEPHIIHLESEEEKEPFIINVEEKEPTNEDSISVIEVHENESDEQEPKQLLELAENEDNTQELTTLPSPRQDEASSDDLKDDSSGAAVSTNAKIDALRMRLRCLEKKHDESMAARNEIYETRFQSVEDQQKFQNQELEETKARLQEFQEKLQQQADQHANDITDQAEREQLIIERLAEIEQRLPGPPTTTSSNTINTDYGVDLQQEQFPTKTSSGAPSQIDNSSPSPTLEQLSETDLQKQVKMEVERLLNEKDSQENSRLEQLSKEDQDKLVELYETSLAKHADEGEDAALGALETVESQIKEELLRANASPSKDASVEVPSSMGSGASCKFASRRAVISGMHSDSTERVNNMFEHDELKESIRKECREMMDRENEALMQTWGTHFQDLATLVQKELDHHRESITEVRSSIFEHVDAESKARASVWNAQYNQLVKQMSQHSQDIGEIKEDQERAMLIVVETLVNMKMKVEEMHDEMESRPVLSTDSAEHSEGTFDADRVVQIVDQRTKVWESKMKHFAADLKKVKTDTHVANCAVADMIQDHDAMQSILDKTIDLFNAKMETSIDVWTIQLDDLKRDMEEYSFQSFASKRDQEKIQKSVDMLVKKLDSTYVDLIQVLDAQAAELRTNRAAQVQLSKLKQDNKTLQEELDAVNQKWRTTYTDLIKVVDGQAEEIKAAQQVNKSLRKKERLTPPTNSERRETAPEDSPGSTCSGDGKTGKKRVTFEDGENIPEESDEKKLVLTARASPTPEFLLLENRQEVEYYDLSNWTDTTSKREALSE